MTVHVIGSIDNLGILIDQPLISALRGKTTAKVKYYPVSPAIHRPEPGRTQLWPKEYLIRHWARSILGALTLKARDRVVFCDFWNPGLLAFTYMAWELDEHIPIFAIYAASSHLPGDFSQDLSWAPNAEAAWAEAAEMIFCPSRFARDRTPSPWRMEVTGLPFTPPDDKVNEIRSPMILIPHRSTPDKISNEYAKAVVSVAKANKSVVIVSSYPLFGAEMLTDDQYIEGPFARKVLVDFQDRAAVVYCPGLSETWGYSWMESATRGCLPIARHAGCYPEFINSSLFTTTNEASAMLERALFSPPLSPAQVAEEYRNRLKHYALVPHDWADRILA